MKKRIVLTGGGSGGHVYPLLAVAEELRRLAISEGANSEIFYIGPRDEYSEILQGENIKIRAISSGKLRRYFSISNLLDIPKFFIGLIQSLFVLYGLMPDAVFSKGGTGALPVILAARFYRIPIMIHESDAVPGLTNLISARFATRIAVSFEKANDYFDPGKTAWVGTPIRRELLQNSINKQLAKQELGFKENEHLILVWSGSQGSQRINEFIVANLPELIKESQILHQTGQGNYSEVQKLSRAALIGVPLKIVAEKRYEAVSYLKDNLKTALSAADLVIARAGSGTISELAAFGKPAILVPLAESAQDHQRANAYEFAKSGGGVVIEESNLLPGIFLSQLRTVLKNPETLNKMSSASAKFFKPDAAEVIAKEVLNIS